MRSDVPRLNTAASSPLATCLARIDGRPYGFYRDLHARSFEVAELSVSFDHIQPDPFAPPSRLRIELAADIVRLPSFALTSPDARRATADLLQRRLEQVPEAARSSSSGSGKSGQLAIAPLGPEVLDRSAVQVAVDGSVRLRVGAGLPARGRRILGSEAAALLTERLPPWIRSTLASLDAALLRRHVECVLDQAALRDALRSHGLVAFVADGSVLPRRTGAESSPLTTALPFRAPEGLCVELEAPHAGRVRGMGIARGITLITGGGYHGKSTLLSALSLGIYDHCPGDGRERCVTSADAVSIRAEDGRSVRGVDLRPFIGTLPLGRSTACFDTDDASGSTSQAAAVIEALEVGAEVLLVDEDTSASNFMLRDARMRSLIPASQEPITPFLDRVAQLRDEEGVSSILVVGGAGDYLDVADRVIQLHGYAAHDVTARARAVARELPLGDAAPRRPGPWPAAPPRVPNGRAAGAGRDRRPERVRSRGTRVIELGGEELDVSALAQLVDPAQARWIGDALLQLVKADPDDSRSIAERVRALEARCAEHGVESIGQRGFGDLASSRRFEIAAALNRLRSLRLR